MPLVLRRPDEDEPSSVRHSELTIAFVNNMPDGAFNVTEEQFFGLLDEGSGALSIEVGRYALPGVPRGAEVSDRIAHDYLPLSGLWNAEVDAVIVTGSEPSAPVLREEPYWNDLVRILETFGARARSLLLSCLSAHAALDLFDGIPRTELPAKCTGVFRQDDVAPHPLTRGLQGPLFLPHSRLNDVPEESVRTAGYEVLLRSDAVGWSVVTRREGRSQLVLVQGHPEYYPSSLLKEYRRDLRRYVTGACEDAPCLPVACVSERDRGALVDLHRRVLAGERDRTLLDLFAFDEAGERADWPWRAMATRFFANWLAEIQQGSC